MSGRGVKSEAEAYSSESDAKLASSSTAASASAAGAKKRPSRAGTRSVTTLSAAQLERKRANDREAQRAIRQRTKEHIEKLERRIAELTGGEDENEREQLVAALKRNKELEDENAFLRSKLDHGGIHMNMGESPGSTWSDVAHMRSPLATENVPMIHQAQLAPGNGSGPLSRAPSAAYPSGGHWQQNPFQPPSPLPRPGTTNRSGDISPEDAVAWQQSMARGGKPIGAGSTLTSSLPQGTDTYGYMISGTSGQSGRPPNPPMPYQQLPEDPRQQMPMGQPSVSQQYSAIGQRGFMPQSQQQQPPPHQQQAQQQPQGPGGDPRGYPPRSQHEHPQMYYQSFQRE